MLESLLYGNSGKVGVPSSGGLMSYPVPYYMMNDQYPSDQAYVDAVNNIGPSNGSQIDYDYLLKQLLAEEGQNLGMSGMSGPGGWVGQGMQAEAPNAQNMLGGLMSMMPQVQQQQRGPGYKNPYVASLMGM